MAITLKQPYYENMINFVNTVAVFYTTVASRDGITTVAGVLHDMALLREECNSSSQRKFTANPNDHEMVKANMKALAYFKTQAKRIEKLFLSLENGLRTKQIGSKTALRAALKDNFKPLVDDMVQHAKKFGVDSSESNPDSLHAIMTSPTTSKVIAHIIESAINASHISEEEVDKEKDEAAHKLLKSYLKKSNDLPSSLHGALFTIVELPVVPLIDYTLLNPKLLKTSGVNFTRVDDNAFYVFEDQVLLAFDFDAATTESDGKRKAPSSATFKKSTVPVLGRDNKPMHDHEGNAVTKTVRVANTSSLPSRRLAQRHRELQESFVLDVVDRINARSSEKYTLISNHFEFHPHNGKIAFAWLVPTRVHRALGKAGNLADAKWGFPWSRAKTSM